MPTTDTIVTVPMNTIYTALQNDAQITDALWVQWLDVDLQDVCQWVAAGNRDQLNAAYSAGHIGYYKPIAYGQQDGCGDIAPQDLVRAIYHPPYYLFSEI